MKAEASAAAGRDRGLDAFRGLAVITMVIANFLADKTIVPAFLKHAPDIGLTVIDLIAPLFVVAMAAPFRDSYERKLLREGKGAAAWDTARRYLALIGIGAILSAGQSFALPAGGMVDWGVLQLSASRASPCSAQWACRPSAGSPSASPSWRPTKS